VGWHWRTHTHTHTHGRAHTRASAMNFICHCSVCRAASGGDALAATAFAPHQLRWVNRAAMRATTPAGSANTRLRCARCDSYVGEDASATLGVLAVPLASMRQPPAACLPNMHIFYASRARDAHDALPKVRAACEEGGGVGAACI